MFAEVIINLPKLASALDYAIPPDLQSTILPGCLVEVPVGKQTMQGIVCAIRAESTVPNIKALHNLLDPFPVVTPQQIELATWLAEETLTPLPACLTLMLPPGLSQQADTLYQRIEELVVEKESISSLQNRILDLLKERGPLRGRQLQHAFKYQNWKAAMQALQRRGWVKSQAVLPQPTTHKKTTPAVRLLKDFAPDIELSKNETVQKRRMRVLTFLKEQSKATPIPWLIAQTGANRADVLLLEKMGLLENCEQESLRDPLDHLSAQSEAAIQLTTEQQTILQALTEQLDHPDARMKPALIHGITGSGKTEIYLRLAAYVLQRGQQVIMLVPEISLTPQTIQRFLNRFPNQVGVIHSRLSPGERYDTWRRIRDGEIKVIVGPRSALFAPCASPALIILDECHDDSFYQREPAPIYDSLQAAIQYGHLCKALVVLGSATPNIQTMVQAQQQNWQIFTLTKRVSTYLAEGKPELPPVEIVDMRQELQAGNRSIFSRALQAALGDVLHKKQQAILFLNRRGSATYVFCRQCGVVLKCPRCDLPLTLHVHTGDPAGNTMLECHTCRYTRGLPNKCPNCGSTQIRQYGSGTEKVQQTVQELFPQASILRWDAETARGKNADEIILNRFASHQADILIGTQMVAKGLDLPLVTLVGVVLADVSLSFPDYRAAERSFQLLTQVAGRAGRSGLGGKVIFQSFQPDHYVIRAAAAHDYQSFYDQETQHRRQRAYPPYSHLLRLEYRHRNAQQAADAAAHMKNNLQQWIANQNLHETEIKGPKPCFFQRINGMYRWEIIISGPDPLALLRGKALEDWRIELDPPSVL
jgi:primosomal protein N' (replication factor Y) (superfamily II helicase)